MTLTQTRKIRVCFRWAFFYLWALDLALLTSLSVPHESCTKWHPSAPSIIPFCECQTLTDQLFLKQCSKVFTMIRVGYLGYIHLELVVIWPILAEWHKHIKYVYVSLDIFWSCDHIPLFYLSSRGYYITLVVNEPRYIPHLLCKALIELEMTFLTSCT